MEGKLCKRGKRDVTVRRNDDLVEGILQNKGRGLKKVVTDIYLPPCSLLLRMSWGNIILSHPVSL